MPTILQKPVSVMLVIFGAVYLATTMANAGDFAMRKIHGFSLDGGLFAFEEYGIQDGSGFPYSNIYIIDTATDKWTASSPYRVLLQDESRSVFGAREEARILAGTVMKTFEDRGLVIATNMPTELGASKKRMIANPRMVIPPIDDPIEFRLETIRFQSTELCESFGQTLGFRLLQIGTKENQVTRIVHEDTGIPSSRHCPLDYDLADIVTYYPQNGTPVAAILILMKTVGFEGPDGRYLAVTTQFQ